jgi:hypothetical protein
MFCAIIEVFNGQLRANLNYDSNGYSISKIVDSLWTNA